MSFLVQCVVLDCSVPAALGRIFGGGQVAHLANLGALPCAVKTLPECGTRE